MKPYQKVRKHILFPLLKIFITIFIFWLVNTIVRRLFDVNNLHADTFLLSRIVEYSIVSYIIISWYKNYASVDEEKFILRSGVIFIRKRILAIQNIESVSLKQSLIGRIMRFGTITMHSPTFKKKIYARNIRKPEKFMHLIEDLIPKTDKDNQRKIMHISAL